MIEFGRELNLEPKLDTRRSPWTNTMVKHILTAFLGYIFDTCKQAFRQLAQLNACPSSD